MSLPLIFYWAAPEVINYDPLSCAADMWYVCLVLVCCVHCAGVLCALCWCVVCIVLVWCVLCDVVLCALCWCVVCFVLVCCVSCVLSVL